MSDQEQNSNDQLSCWEVNPDTSPSGIVPIGFSADPPTIPFTSVVIEVTESEFEKIHSGSLHLPTGWYLGDLLYPPAA